MPEIGTWTSVLSGERCAAGRVVVVPHAGGGPTALAALLAGLPADVEVMGVTLPGRGSRAAEPFQTLATDPMRVVETIAGELAALPPAPTVLFGHSLGAALAAAVATTAPELFRHVVLSAPPATADPRELAGRWSDERLLGILHRSGTTPDDMLASPAWRRHLVDVLRVDLTLGVRTTHLFATRRLPVPLTLLTGVDDDVAPPLDLPSWSARASAGLRVRNLPGGHFYLLDEDNIAEVAAELTAPLAGGGGSRLAA